MFVHVSKLIQIWNQREKLLLVYNQEHEGGLGAMQFYLHLMPI